MSSASHIVPAVILFGLGCVSATQAVTFTIAWRREGRIRAEGRLFGWAPFGDAQTAVSLLARLSRTKQENAERKREIRNPAAISARIAVFVLLAIVLWAGAYQYARVGHGFGS